VELKPRLIEVAVPARPAGTVVVLHGGASRRANMMVSPTQLSVLRMIPVAHQIARVGRGQLAVFRLLNSVRGWDTRHTPVRDVWWALDQAAERLGNRVPTCLVGHSLGGRAALLAANRPEVRSAVALAPWVDPNDDPHGLSGRQLLIIHGSHDRVASPERSAALARRLSRQARVGYITVDGGTHAMLKRHELFDGLAAEFASTTVLGAPSTGPIARVLAGESWIQV
jgi:pimeloyl-ACP methyl ester carboxylesterase